MRVFAYIAAAAALLVAPASASSAPTLSIGPACTLYPVGAKHHKRHNIHCYRLMSADAHVSGLLVGGPR